MNAELDKFMAEVMGWSKVLIYNVWRYAESAEKYINYIDWHPTEDRGQAIDCLEKFCKDAHCYANFIFNLDELKWSVYVWNEVDIRESDADIEGEGVNDKLPLAICESIKQALEAK